MTVIVLTKEANVDVTVEPGFEIRAGLKIPTRVRLDVWSCGDAASAYLTPDEAHELSTALIAAAITAEGKGG